MATWKFWESMGGYGRRHPPTPEAAEDKPATHAQYRNSWRQCPSDLSDLSDLSDIRHLSYRPYMANDSDIAGESFRRDGGKICRNTLHRKSPADWRFFPMANWFL